MKPKRIPITVKLPPLLVLWLRTRPEGVTGTIQRLIEAELDKKEIKMATTTIYKSDYKTEREYREEYKKIETHYRVKVDDGKGGTGWMFFETDAEMETWKNQK